MQERLAPSQGPFERLAMTIVVTVPATTTAAALVQNHQVL
jgi:hypothetical protein